MKITLTTRPAVTCNCGYQVLVSAGAPLSEQPECSSEIDEQLLHFLEHRLTAANVSPVGKTPV